MALILFLVSVFSALHRSNLGMAAFYDGRADALLMMWFDDSGHALAELADVFGPNTFEFARSGRRSNRSSTW